MQSSSVTGDEVELDARQEADRWKWFGVWLAERRLALGMTKKEVAERAEISVSTLANLEAGGRIWKGQWLLPSPAAVTLVKLASSLGLDSEEVFGRAGRTSPVPPVHVAPSVEQRLAALEAQVAEIRELMQGMLLRDGEP